MSEKNEIMTINPNDLATPSLVSALQNPGTQMFCSIRDDGSRSSKAKIYNAVNGAAEQLSDHINETLSIKDVVAHEIMLPDMQTGEVTNCLRTVLIAEDGTAYQAVSQGVVSSLSKIFAIVGMPTWDEPVHLTPMNVKTKQGFKVLTLVMSE